MGGEAVRPERGFEFFNQASNRAVCKKEFDSLPAQVKTTFLTRIMAWRRGEELPGGQLSPFAESKYKHLFAFKYSWRGDTYRLIFLVHASRGVGLTAFQKKSTSGSRATPKGIIQRVEQRHQIYCKAVSPNSTPM